VIDRIVRRQAVLARQRNALHQLRAIHARRWAVVRADDDRGNAIVEFVFVAVLVLVPLIYLIVAVAVVQRSRLAVTNAARDVGRAIATSTSRSDAEGRAAAALRIALANQHMSAAEVEVRYVAVGADCASAATLAPKLGPGSEFMVCVIRRQDLPAIPAVLSGHGITTIGRYVVHMDDFVPLGR
jgi:Flp pilus assembly protein TadG